MSKKLLFRCLCFSLVLFATSTEGQSALKNSEKVKSLGEMSQKESFEFLKKLSLRDIQMLTLKSSRTLRIAMAKVTSARLSYQGVKSEYWPNITASHDRSKSRVDKVLPFSFPRGSLTSWKLDARISLYDRGREIRRKLGLAEINLAKDDREISARELKLLATQYYFEVLRLRTLILQAQVDYEFEDENLQDALKMKKQGQASEMDILSFENRIDERKGVGLDLELRWKILILELSALFSVPSEKLASLSMLEPPQIKISTLPPLKKSKALPPAKEWVRRTLKNRSELSKIRQFERSSALRSDLSKSVFLPRVSLFGNFTRSESFGAKENSTLSGLHISLNLFNGLKDIRDLADKKIQEHSLRLERMNLELRLATEVETLWTQIDIARRKMELYKTGLERSKKFRDMVQKSYRSGRSDVFKLNDAQNSYRAAWSRLLETKISHEKGIEDIKLLSGL